VRVLWGRLAAAVSVFCVLVVPLVAGAVPAAAAPARPTCPANPAELAGQHVDAKGTRGSLVCADLRGAILDGVDLTQADMTGADAEGASFRRAMLVQAQFSGANLRGAHFENADMGQAQMDGVDARGAFFGNADLGQADLHTGDLRDADFVHASLVQADLKGTDLRGAHMYWTETIQADVSGARVRLTDAGVPQLSLLGILAGLILIVLSLVDLLRGRRSTLWWRPAVARLSAYAAVSLFLWLVGSSTAPQMFLVLWPFLVGAGLAVLSGFVRLLPARRRAMADDIW